MIKTFNCSRSNRTVFLSIYVVFSNFNWTARLQFSHLCRGSLDLVKIYLSYSYFSKAVLSSKHFWSVADEDTAVKRKLTLR